MDRKGIFVLLASFALLMLWVPLTNKLYPPIPAPELTNQTSVVHGDTNNLYGSDTNAASPSSARDADPKPSSSLQASDPLPDRSNEPESLLTLENDEVLLTITSHGGGLKQVELKNHYTEIGCSDDLQTPTNRITLHKDASQPVLALNGDPALAGDGVFDLSQNGKTIRAEQTLAQGLRIIKEFSLASNHLIQASVEIVNQTGQPMFLPAHSWVTGMATPIGLQDESMHMGLYWFDGNDTTHIDSGWYANRFLMCFPGTPRYVYQGGQNNVDWISTHNQFYTLTVIPDGPAASITAVKTNLPPRTDAQMASERKVMRNPYGFLTSLQFASTNLPPDGVYRHDFLIYAGPKEYKTLARLGESMENRLDLIMGYGGFFGFFAKILLLSMNGLHSLGLSYALAIICITIIIKLLFWPLTTASTKSMKRMAALQPQMKALQEKYKEDPAKMNRKLMEFMKEHKVSPLGGCLPMLLQIPVFFGFYRMILTATELRGEQFLWACDLSKADTIWVIPGIDFPLNPLPLLMGATMLIQTRLTPMSPGMDPMQQKIMRYLPLMFVPILYNFSAGLTLYWTVQNILTIVQTKLTRTEDPSSTPSPGASTAPAAPAKPQVSFSTKKKKKRK